MKTESTSLFRILRRHAATHPDAIASRSSRRTVSYRKFWSRIERATARLISEWQVNPGDVVAYWGRGHQDALMLYIAVARCGARLLPLEHASLQNDAAAILRLHPPKLLLHDDDVEFDVLPSTQVVSHLSALIATRCHHQPVVTEDDMQPSLIAFEQAGTSAPVLIEHSLHELCRTQTGERLSPFRVNDVLFDMPLLSSSVLPVLKAGGTIIFP
jgi:acyl-CoA synthetase (AMP-forming)/AMP-acid ligase II